MVPMIVGHVAVDKEIEIRRQVEQYEKHLDQLEKAPQPPAPEKKPRLSLLERLHLLPPKDEEWVILE